MKRWLTKTPVLVLVLVAAILATTAGGAVAGALVTSKQIKDNTITTADIKNGTITRADLARSAIIAGPRGATGAAGVSGYEQIDTTKAVGAGEYAELSLTCSPGKKLLSASGFWVEWTNPVQVEYTSASTATAYVTGPAEDDTLVLVAVCAKVA